MSRAAVSPPVEVQSLDAPALLGFCFEIFRFGLFGLYAFDVLCLFSFPERVVFRAVKTRLGILFQDCGV
jgi:hypothetical protein